MPHRFGISGNYFLIRGNNVFPIHVVRKLPNKYNVIFVFMQLLLCWRINGLFIPGNFQLVLAKFAINFESYLELLPLTGR